jgi:hypothetical protein
MRQREVMAHLGAGGHRGQEVADYSTVLGCGGQCGPSLWSLDVRPPYGLG